MGDDEDTGRYGQYGRDAEVLGKIGAVLFPQATTLSVRLPRELADLALAAWHRQDGQGGHGPETAGQRAARYRAGTLALIGLCVESTGRADGDEIICELDAWYIGSALDAADQHGLIAGELPAADRGRLRPVAGGPATPPAADQD